MPHPGLAPSNPVGLEQAHLRPAQAKAIADGVVDFLGGGDAVLDQPQSLAPDSLKETVGDMGVDFLADMQGIAADAGQNVLGRSDQLWRVGVAGHQFDQRQQVDRVERMRHNDLAGAG